MNSLLKKLKGYQRAPRGRFLLLKEGRLTQEELLLYELAVAITDWDPRHETYGTFEATNQEIADLLEWKSDTTPLKHKKSLIKKGMFIVAEDNRLIAKGFEKWQLRRSNPSKNEPLTAEKQIGISKIEDETSEIKEDQSQNDDYSLVSSKVDLSLSNEIPNESLSNVEIGEIILALDKEENQNSPTSQKRSLYANS